VLKLNATLSQPEWNGLIQKAKKERKTSMKSVKAGDQLFVLYNPRDGTYLPFSKDEVAQLELKILEPPQPINEQLKKARDEYIKERNDAEYFIKDALKKWTKKVYIKRTTYQNTKRKMLKPQQTSTAPTLSRQALNYAMSSISNTFKKQGGRKTQKQKTQKIRINNRR
jgi:hypothetical protein